MFSLWYRTPLIGTKFVLLVLRIPAWKKLKRSLGRLLRKIVDQHATLKAKYGMKKAYKFNMKRFRRADRALKRCSACLKRKCILK